MAVTGEVKRDKVWGVEENLYWSEMILNGATHVNGVG